MALNLLLPLKRKKKKKKKFCHKHLNLLVGREQVAPEKKN